MKLLTQLPAWLRNKFFIAFAAFAVWMLFFDERDVFTMQHHRQALKPYPEERTPVVAKIAHHRRTQSLLRFN